jgi:hypothetical protein
MADAVVSIGGRYRPFLAQLWAPSGASAEAAGIHYRFDIEASPLSCTQVADYVFDNYMRPDRGSRH